MASNDTATVTVGCKLPHGFHLDVYAVVDGQPSVIARHTIKGANESELIGGHGITLGVPKDHWETWLAANKGSAMVRNEMIFAHDKAEAVAAKAKGNASNKTGFEAIDPDKPGAGIEKSDAKS